MSSYQEINIISSFIYNNIPLGYKKNESIKNLGFEFNNIGLISELGWICVQSN